MNSSYLCCLLLLCVSCYALTGYIKVSGSAVTYLDPNKTYRVILGTSEGKVAVDNELEDGYYTTGPFTVEALQYVYVIGPYETEFFTYQGRDDHTLAGASVTMTLDEELTTCELSYWSCESAGSAVIHLYS
jgi:hypothetical protein